MDSRWLILATLALATAGCTDSSSTTDADQSVVHADHATVNSNGMKRKDPNGKKSAAIPLQISNWGEIQHWVAEQRGNIVVVDVWSTFCLPCLKEFPNFIALHEMNLENVVCASLSLDFYGGAGNSPEEVRPQVLAFLTAQNATMENFISSDADSAILKEIDTSAVPAVLVYDRDGQLHKVFNNDNSDYGPDGFSYQEHIVPVVKSLIRATE